MLFDYDRRIGTTIDDSIEDGIALIYTSRKNVMDYKYHSSCVYSRLWDNTADVPDHDDVDIRMNSDTYYRAKETYGAVGWLRTDKW